VREKENKKLKKHDRGRGRIRESEKYTNEK
jgi:hypothetical protein